MMGPVISRSIMQSMMLASYSAGKPGRTMEDIGPLRASAMLVRNEDTVIIDKHIAVFSNQLVG